VAAWGVSLSMVAVGFDRGLIFGMPGPARGLAGELRGQIDRAAEASRWSLVVVAALAVGREGLETALFLWAATQTATGAHTVSTVPAWQPLTGAVLGIATAVVLGYLLYRGAVKINLAKFFTWTGAFLIVVAAGVLAYGVHDLQEAGVLPGLNSLVFDVSSHIDEGSWYGALLKGVFNFSPQTTWLQAVVWTVYLVVTMTLFLRGVRRPTHTPAPPVPRDKQPA
jgi:high-affinity iron transporter